MIQATPSLSFGEALNASTSKIFQFTGRARRSEYWWTQLLVYIASIVLTPIAGCLLSLLTIPLTFRRLHDTGRSGWWWGIGALLKLAFVIIICYDSIKLILNANNPDLFVEEFAINFLLKYGLLSVVIGIYEIILIILCCIDSSVTANRYGASPKYVDADTEENRTDSQVNNPNNEHTSLEQ